MTGALIILAVTVATGLLLWLTHKPDPAPHVEEQPSEPAPAEECCGVHAICSKQMQLADGPDYYDDEELDRFRSRDPEEYSPAEVAEFREVMMTLQPDEVYAWASALTRREIPFPTELRPELMMLIEDHV